MVSPETLLPQAVQTTSGKPARNRRPGGLRGAQRSAAIDAAWRKTGSSAERMVARCTVRDTRTPGAHRFQWSVMILGRSDPIAAGHAAERLEAREQAAAALAGYAAQSRPRPRRPTN